MTCSAWHFSGLNSMTIAIGADHRGFALKEQLRIWLTSDGHTLVDCGNTRYDKDDDFPDFAFAVADTVAARTAQVGIVLCGSAGGVVIAANKVKGIRCAWGVTKDDVLHNRSHNDTNVLALAADTTNEKTAQALITTFLETLFGEEDRCIRRLDKISSREALL